MYAVIRHYQGASAGALDAVVARRAEVEDILRGVPGFVAYYAVRSDDGSATITICDDQAGTEESSRRAAAWVRANFPAAAGSPPTITQGQVTIDFTR
ncbi:MAG: hypothetical protein IT340_20705 [Chloroflexi bacterium]|nr:hypothetical protein [Chloroflexota bacterium]